MLLQAVRSGQRPHKMLTIHYALIHNDFIVSPERIAACHPVRASCSCRTNPDDLDVICGRTSIGAHAVPLIRDPGSEAEDGIVVPIDVASVPSGIPLHDEMVVGVGGIAPDLSIERTVYTIGQPGEDSSLVVVPALIESISHLMRAGDHAS